MTGFSGSRTLRTFKMDFSGSRSLSFIHHNTSRRIVTKHSPNPHGFQTPPRKIGTMEIHRRVLCSLSRDVLITRRSLDTTVVPILLLLKSVRERSSIQIMSESDGPSLFQNCTCSHTYCTPCK